MKSRGLSPLIVAVVGSILCLISVGCITNFMIMRTNQQIAAAQARIDATGIDWTEGTKQAALKDQKLATVQVNAAKVLWHEKELALMPQFNETDRYTAWKQISHELAENLGPNIERWIRHSGVTPVTAITLDPPPANPNGVTAAPLIIPISGGNLSVAGDFRSILNHIVKWNNFNRLVLIDNLSLKGNSPFMEGDYSAEVIILPQNGDKLGPPLAQAGGAGGAANGASAYSSSSYPMSSGGGMPGRGGP